jgi:hypothetical protein
VSRERRRRDEQLLARSADVSLLGATTNECRCRSSTRTARGGHGVENSSSDRLSSRGSRPPAQASTTSRSSGARRDPEHLAADEHVSLCEGRGRTAAGGNGSRAGRTGGTSDRASASGRSVTERCSA